MAPPEDAFARTAAPADRPAEPAEIVVAFERGLPVALDGDASDLPSVIRALDALGGSLRLRPGGHDREPPRRHQVARAVRGARRARDHPRAPRARGPHARARGRAPQAARGAALGRPGLRRPVVQPAARRDRRLRRRDADARDRRRAPAVRTRRLHRGRTPVGALALRPVARHVRQRRRVRPVARGGLRPALRAAAQGVVREAEGRRDRGWASDDPLWAGALLGRRRPRRWHSAGPCGSTCGWQRTTSRPGSRTCAGCGRGACSPRTRRRAGDALRTSGRRIADGRSSFDPAGRGRALGDRARCHRPARRPGREAARGAQPQRPRRHRPAPVAARAAAAGSERRCGDAGVLVARAREHERDGDARHHARAVRAARHARPPPAGARVGAGARRRATGTVGASAPRSRRWGPARSPPRPSASTPMRPRRAWGLRGRSRTRSTRSATATSSRSSWPTPRSAPRTCRAWRPTSRGGPMRRSAGPELDEAYTTGSSMMPQKRNPDIAGAGARQGRAGAAGFAQLASVLQGLPAGYHRDLQEDKEPAFDAADTLELVLPALAGAVGTIRFDVDAMRAAPRRRPLRHGPRRGARAHRRAVPRGASANGRAAEGSRSAGPRPARSGRGGVA